MRRWTLIAILAVAAIARFWALSFCLPGQLCRPDEEAVAGIATQFFGRDFDPHFFDWPTLFMYATALGLAAYFDVGRLLGWFRSELGFIARIVTDATPIYLTARILSATAGTFAVWVLYRIARRLADELTALVAALFLALAFLHARDSHFGVADVTATTLALVSFLFAVRLEENGRLRDMLGAAIAAGLAASTKYNAALIVLPALWALRTRWRWMAAFCAVAFAAFAATSPYCLIDVHESIAALRSVSAHLANGHGAIMARGWIVHLTSSLRYGIGLPMVVTGIAGIVWVLWRDWRRGVLVAIFPLAYYAIVGAGYTVFARYAIPLVPWLCLTAAIGIVDSMRAVAAAIRRRQRATAFAWTAAVLIVAPSAVSLVEFDRLLGMPDSRVVAADWVRQHFPKGAAIAEVGRRSTGLFFVRESNLVPSRYRTVAFENDASAVENPELLMIPTSLFDPQAPIPSRAARMASEYIPAFVVDAHGMTARGVVYDWQDEFYLPLTGFREVWRPGPNVTIYVRPDLQVRWHSRSAVSSERCRLSG